MLTDRLDCRSRQTTWGLFSRARREQRPTRRGPSAHRVRVKSRSEAASPWPSGGSSGGCRRSGELARRRVGRSVDGRRSGLTTARCWRIARGWVLGALGTARFGGPGKEHDMERQRNVHPARVLPNKHTLGREPAKTRGSPYGEDERCRSRRLRRTIAAPPGAGGAGNSAPASAVSSPLSARVSARVVGRRAKRRANSRKRRARESRDRWVLVATSRLQRSQMSISRGVDGRLRTTDEDRASGFARPSP